MKSTFEEQLDAEGKLVYINTGDSMMPLIRQHRDILIITKPDEWKNLDYDGTKKLSRLDIPLYKRDSGQYVLHRVLKVRKNDYVICGDNRFSREYGISDRHVIGVLSSIVRDGKEMSVKKGKWRIYAHLYCDFFYIRALILWMKRKLKFRKSGNYERKS